MYVRLSPPDFIDLRFASPILSDLAKKKAIDNIYADYVMRQTNAEYVLTTFLCAVISPLLLFGNINLAECSSNITSLQDLYEVSCLLVDFAA